MHRFDEARDLQEEEKRGVVRRARDAYRGVLSGVSRVKALKRALESAQVAVQASEAGMEVGTRTIVDVLVEQRRQFQANRTVGGFTAAETPPCIQKLLGRNDIHGRA